MPTAATLPSRDIPARPAAETRVQLLDAQLPDSGGTVLRLRLTLGGRSAQTVAARDSFALLRRDGGEEPPADSRPVFETLEPGATIDFVPRFAGTDGVTLAAATCVAPTRHPDRTCGRAVSRWPPGSSRRCCGRRCSRSC